MDAVNSTRLAGSRKLRLIAFILFFLLPATFVRAQGEGSIEGTVRDASGGEIPNATVQVKNLETGAVRNLISDDSGRFVAPGLTVGNYEVTAEKAGFHTSK